MQHGRTRNKGEPDWREFERVAHTRPYPSCPYHNNFGIRDATKREKSSKIARGAKTAMGTTTVSKISGEHGVPRYRQATRTPVLWGCQSTDRMTSLLSRTDHKAGRARDRGTEGERERRLYESDGEDWRARRSGRFRACYRDNGSPR